MAQRTRSLRTRKVQHGTKAGISDALYLNVSEKKKKGVLTTFILLDYEQVTVSVDACFS